MKYTVVALASRNNVIMNIEYEEHKASKIKRKRNVATQKYSTKNKGKVKTTEGKEKFKEQQSKSIEQKKLKCTNNISDTQYTKTDIGHHFLINIMPVAIFYSFIL